MPRPPDDTRDEIRSSTRQRLLDAAAEEFARNGFVGANINQISTAAGFAKGTIYNYFDSKRGLMAALLEMIAEKHTSFIRDGVKLDSPPRERLTQFFLAGYAFVQQFPALARVAISIVYGHDQAFREQIFQAYRDLFGVIQEGILVQGVGDGVFGLKDTNLGTALLMSLYLGSISLLGPDGVVWFKPEDVATFVYGGIQDLPEAQADVENV